MTGEMKFTGGVALLLWSLAAGCGPSNGDVIGQWYDAEHSAELQLDRFFHGSYIVDSDALSVRYTVSWKKSGGKFQVQMFCRQVYDLGQECTDPGYEDFELECEYVKETVKTENNEDDELICSGPEGTYNFEAVI